MQHINTVMVIYHYNPPILHMTNLERLNAEIQRRGVVTSGELTGLASDVLGVDEVDYRYLFTEYLSKLLERGQVVRPRQGIYVAAGVRGPGSPPVADRYVLASKVAGDYYLGFHTALELHGCAYSHFGRVAVCVPRGKRFRPFEFQDTIYMSVSTSFPGLGTESVARGGGHDVVLSNPARTFVDCLDRPRLAGGWEEVLKSLASLPGVKGDMLLEVLRRFGKKVLYRKAGLVLELLERSIYYEDVLEEVRGALQERARGGSLYMDRNAPGPQNERWNIYEVPNIGRMMEGI